MVGMNGWEGNGGKVIVIFGGLVLWVEGKFKILGWVVVKDIFFICRVVYWER